MAIEWEPMDSEFTIDDIGAYLMANVLLASRARDDAGETVRGDRHGLPLQRRADGQYGRGELERGEASAVWDLENVGAGHVYCHWGCGKCGRSQRHEVQTRSRGAMEPRAVGDADRREPRQVRAGRSACGQPIWR